MVQTQKSNKERVYEQVNSDKPVVNGDNKN